MISNEFVAIISVFKTRHFFGSQNSIQNNRNTFKERKREENTFKILGNLVIFDYIFYNYRKNNKTENTIINKIKMFILTR